MTVLLIDALIALTKIVDRGITAVKKNVRLRATSPGPVDGAQPAGAGAACASATGAGGHPIRSTSQLLNSAAAELNFQYGERMPAVIRDLRDDLKDRAAQYAALGD